MRVVTAPVINLSPARLLVTVELAQPVVEVCVAGAQVPRAHSKHA